MNILLSNDDGYKSSGLKVLKNVLEEYGDVTTVAPHRDISASSSCLSVHSPVQIKKISKNFYKIYGTPADCVHIGSRGIMKKNPDIVFSGVNIGSNMGDDVIYSGTVGAAIEGRHSKYGSVAISIASKNPEHITDLNYKLKYIIEYIFHKLISQKAIININIPDLPFSKIKGFKITKLGKRKQPLKALPLKKNKNRYFNIGGVGKGISAEGNDFHAIEKGFISITPLTIDMTNSEVYNKIK
ncbi:MAG: 5'/3'-nucleotidase SurE [Gammaproteobacteria bacterium]|mgnify:FL=1